MSSGLLGRSAFSTSSRRIDLRRDRLGLVAAAVFVMMGLAALLAPFVTPYGVREIVGLPLQGPTSAHWLGTDEIGRDILTRVVHGGRISLTVGLVATAVAAVIGIPWGMLSGFRGGLFDTISMRATDGMLAFPGIVLALSAIAVLGPSIRNMVIAIAIVHVPRFVRLVRAEVLTLREREFVHAARAIGARDGYIMRQVIMPNTVSMLTVQFTLTFATAVLTEASLSFLGLGVRPPTPSWGSMLSTARNFTTLLPIYSIAAGGAVFVSVLSLSLVGDALRDLLDPRARWRTQE